jgi:hypothetical protein
LKAIFLYLHGEKLMVGLNICCCFSSKVTFGRDAKKLDPEKKTHQH